MEKLLVHQLKGTTKKYSLDDNNAFKENYFNLDMVVVDSYLKEGTFPKNFMLLTESLLCRYISIELKGGYKKI